MSAIGNEHQSHDFPLTSKNKVSEAIHVTRVCRIACTESVGKCHTQAAKVAQHFRQGSVQHQTSSLIISRYRRFAANGDEEEKKVKR